MASYSFEENKLPANSTVVAIDRDKSSQYAVRWAIDNLVISNPLITLVHVRLNNQNQNDDGANSENEDLNRLFIPYRGYCARKGLQLKEVVLEDTDVARALLDYVNKNLVNNMVLGVSTKSSFVRSLKFNKPPDPPTACMKAAPDFCSVYIISKGKVQSVRTSQRPISNTLVPPRIPSPGIPPQSLSDSEQEAGVRGPRHPRSGGQDRHSFENAPRGVAKDRHRNASAQALLDFDLDMQQARGQRNSTGCPSLSNDSDFSVPLSLGSIDISLYNLDFSVASSSPKESTSLPPSMRDVEAEMRRLKQELKQTMDMYSTACKQALSAKKKANELHQWKIEEARKFEEARLAEEAALAIVEMEKAKCKAAMEAAEKAQRMVELEAQRRKQAEMKAKKEAEEKDRALSALAQNDVRYRKYSIEEIEEATEKFAAKNKIGEGGYGPVYKGRLDHTPVAIKVLRPDAAQGKKQFQQEVEVLSCIRHPNMVLLLGACPEYGCLVYEYMENGSLEDRLIGRGSSPPLSWRKRFQIAAEIATALLFLHQAKPEPLVHRDLKPANILIDRNFVSKISDVGLARLVPASVADSVTQYHMTSAAGTFCYIDPEYQQTGMLTTKSDIYSLGIMLLQIITAKSPMGLAHHVTRAIERGNFAEMLDPAVADWPIEEALAFAKLSLKCSELRKKDRPNLGSVIVPELNRLRDFGSGIQASSSSSSRHSHYGHRNSSSHSRNRVPRSPTLSAHLRLSNQSEKLAGQEQD